MAALGRYWTDWVQRYTSDGAYWYVPKGKSIGDIPTIQKQLALLEQFEGERWRKTQRAYLTSLAAAGLSKATTKDDDEQGIPMSRMLAQVFSTLGFAWIDENEAVTLTPAGEAFAKASDPAAIVATQSRRYRISNPMAGGKATREIEVHPVPFLLEVLTETKTLTPVEYILFCAKAKNSGDLEDAIESIGEWRKLGPRRQETTIAAVEAVQIGSGRGKSTRRTSIYNTIRLDSSYALAFWTSSRLIQQVQKDGKTLFRIPRDKMPDANALIKREQKDGQFIAFESKKDWMAFYGDPAKPANRTTALSYYTDTAQLDMVRQVLDEMGGYTEEEKRQYLSMIVNEQTVEDILERNMDLIEPGMTLVKRQLETEVGRIDLFARDKRGVYTIIELKKGRTDDDAFGQLSRYLGWCKKTKARTENVRGIIIAKQIGPKLWAAVDGHQTPVELMEYDLKMSLEKARREAPGA